MSKVRSTKNTKLPEDSSILTINESIIKAPEAMFESVLVAPTGIVENKAIIPNPEPAPPVPNLSLSKLFPVENISLSETEQQLVNAAQESRLILGPVSMAPLHCEGEKCIFNKWCPLVQIHKAPLGKVCPIEALYVIERFQGWMKQLGVDQTTLNETQRIGISKLVSYDIQDARCLAKLEGAKAGLTTMNVRESDPNTGSMISWEEVAAAETEIMRENNTDRRMILSDLELTPAAQTKKIKLEGRKGRDYASRLSSARDKLLDIIPTPSS